MEKRDVTFAEAGELIGEWGDRRIRPLVVPRSGPLDVSIEDACDGLCVWLAEDPERDLSTVPEPLLRLFWARLLYVSGICRLKADEIIGRVPETAGEDDVLRCLLGDEIAKARLPSEWRAGPPGGWLH